MGEENFITNHILIKKNTKKFFISQKKNKIKCFASVWSLSDLETLASVSKDIVKIPSPEAYNLKLIEKSLQIFKQVIVSAGCLNYKELKRLFRFRKNNKLIILHCVSSYPLESKDCNFKKFYYLKFFFNKVGYSGHLDGIEDAVYAIANDAVLVEKHFTLKRSLPGRDNKFSLIPKEFSKLSRIRDMFFEFDIPRGLNIQKNEKDVFKFYRGRWQKN